MSASSETWFELNAHRDAGLLGDCAQGGEEQAAGGRAKRGLGD